MDKFLKETANRERLFNDYTKYGSLTIGYDFDDTVYDYHGTGEGHDLVIKLLRELKKVGFTLICWTAQKDLIFVENFLKENDIPCDGINTNGIDLGWETKKPFFSALLDDRAGLRQVYQDLKYVVNKIKLEKWEQTLKNSQGQ